MSFSVKPIIIGLCVIVSYYPKFLLATDGFCNTPNGAAGSCVPLTTCDELFKLLKKRPVAPTDLAFLQKSTCDVSGSQPKVCCPRGNDANIPTTGELIHQEENTILHKNFNLLPNISECGRSILTETVADRIVGGQDAGLGAYPWMVLLGFAAEDEPVQYACGGTLISSKYVLTAVRLGEYNQLNKTDCEYTTSGKKLCAPPLQDMEVEEIIPHEDYDKGKSRENDIALVRLKKHAALGPYVSPICLPHGQKLQRSSPENKVFVAGWGRLAYDSPESAPVLQVVGLKIVSQADCNRFYAHKENFGDRLDDGRFCAGGDKVDSCKGDSGGPLMMPVRPLNINTLRIFQLGVVSLGPSRCGHAGQPALYTKTSHFMNWIYDHLRP